MTQRVITLENASWKVGILPDTGASVAFGQFWNGSAWIDVMRPTDPADYGNASKCASFIMLPWCNRIRDGVLKAAGQRYQLRTAPEDNTARHGDVRNRPLKTVKVSNHAVTCTFDSRDFTDINWPFAFTAQVRYMLDGPRFTWDLQIRNVDKRSFPAGFGHHPYFVKTNTPPTLQIPCTQQFDLTDSMAHSAPHTVDAALNFVKPRPMGNRVYDDVLTGRIPNGLVRMSWDELDVILTLDAEPVFAHWLLYAPEGQPFIALEPMTNVNDGFNLVDAGIEGSGVFILSPGEMRGGTFSMTVMLAD